MINILILQKYLMPYRVPLFNAIAERKNINLSVLFYGTKEVRRKSTIYPETKFTYEQSRVLSIKSDYDYNYDIPLSLYLDLKRFKPDIIICAPDFGGVAALIYTTIHNSKYIIWSEGTHLTEKSRNCLRIPFRKMIYSRAWRFLVPGQLAAAYIRSFVSNADIFLANNAIQFEECFQITEKELEEKFAKNIVQITFSGSIIKDKGITLLIDAFRSLLNNHPKYQQQYFLKILGTGPLDLRNYYDKNIIFTGFIEGQDYIHNMKASHIFVLPSLHDCNPLTVIEALFAGNILIVSDAVGNYPEAVQGNGLVIPTGSSEEIYKALKYILSLPRQELTQMAKRSLELSGNFTVQRSALGFIKAIFYKN